MRSMRRFSPSGIYYSSGCESVKEHVEHIRGYPIVPKPEIFGLHENADITCDQNETCALLHATSAWALRCLELLVFGSCETCAALAASPRVLPGALQV